MKKIFKNLTFFLILTFAPISALMAQKFLDKAKEKLNQVNLNLANGGSKVGEKEIKAAEEDAASTLLDSKSFTKDRHGFGGVYLAKDVMLGYIENVNKAIPMKKFLVDFDEKTLKLSISSQYAFETDEAKKIAPMVFGTTDDVKVASMAFRTSVGIKEPWLPLINGRQRYGFQTYTKYNDGSGVFVRSKSKSVQKIEEMATDIIMMEPGILILRSREFYLGFFNAKTGEYDKSAREYQYAKIMNGMVLYKPEKKAKAEALTDEAINDFLEEHCKKYYVRAAKKIDGQKEYEDYINSLIAKQSAASASSSSSSAPTASASKAPLKDITIYLVNKSDNKIDIVIHSAKGGSKQITSINGRTRRAFRAEVGGKVTNGSGGLLTMIGAEMNKQEVIIAQ